MIDLELQIKKTLKDLTPKNKTGIALSGLKKTLNSSSQIVDATKNFGDDLQDNIEDTVGGFTGAVVGWVAGKSTKLVGGVTGGIVAGTLKTVAGIIPDSSDAKSPETDKKVAHCINTYTLPADKNKLFELLQFTWNNIHLKNSPFGKQTIEAFKNLYQKVLQSFQIAAADDNQLQKLAEPYINKKKYKFF